VIALWPFGLNPGISGRIRAVPELPVGFEQRYEHGHSSPSGPRYIIEWLRFAWRRPAPDAADVLAGLSTRRRIVITSGRSRAGEQVLRDWLTQHQLDTFVDDVYLSPGGLTTRQHKLAVLQMHNIREHVDDDPTAVSYLAGHGISNLYLRTWPNAAGADVPSNVARIESLAGLLDLVT